MATSVNGKANTVSQSMIESNIIDGNHFFFEDYATLNSGDTFYVKLEIPQNCEIHMCWDISGTGELTTELYEGPSGGMEGGTEIVPLNSNRNMSKQSLVTVTKNVSAPTDTGTTVSKAKAGAGSRKYVETATFYDRKLLLKAGTTYCRKIESGSDNNIVSFRAAWLEDRT